MSDMELVKEFKKFLKNGGFSQAQAGKSIGRNAGAISTWVNNKYKGDNKSLEIDIRNLIENSKIKKTTKDEKIVELNNLESIHFIIEEAIMDREMALIYGISGSGKTESLKAFAKNNPTAILIEVTKTMTTKELLQKIGAKAKVAVSGSADTILDTLANAFKKGDRVLLIDEAENLTTASLEAIRRIWDFSKLPTVLAGTPFLINNLKGRNGDLAQLLNRFTGRWELRAVSDTDWKLLFGEDYELITQHTTHLRSACNLYMKAKRYANRKKQDLNGGHVKQALSMLMLDGR